MHSGLVNAGGDLRAFGNADWPVAVRNPVRRGCAHILPALRNRSLATSAWVPNAAGKGAHVDPIGGRVAPRYGSVSVYADNCTIADALTKVVLMQGEAAAALL